jgi:hypothetical protein
MSLLAVACCHRGYCQPGKSVLDHLVGYIGLGHVLHCRRFEGWGIFSNLQFKFSLVKFRLNLLRLKGIKQNRFVQDLIIAKLMRPLKGLFTSFACLKTNPLSGTGKGFVQGPKKGILSSCNSKVQGIRGPQGMFHGHNPFRCPFKIAGAY